MKMNRVQFQRGLSMAEFMERYGNDDKCEAALVASRWPSGFACPACGGGHSSSFVSVWATQVDHCGAAG